MDEEEVHALTEVVALELLMQGRGEEGRALTFGQVVEEHAIVEAVEGARPPVRAPASQAWGAFRPPVMGEWAS